MRRLRSAAGVEARSKPAPTKTAACFSSLGGNAKELWQTAGGGDTFKVLDPKRVTVLMDSPDMAKAFGSGLVAARFRYEAAREEGRVREGPRPAGRRGLGSSPTRF